MFTLVRRRACAVFADQVVGRIGEGRLGLRRGSGHSGRARSRTRSATAGSSISGGIRGSGTTFDGSAPCCRPQSTGDVRVSQAQQWRNRATRARHQLTSSHQQQLCVLHP